MCGLPFIREPSGAWLRARFTNRAACLEFFRCTGNSGFAPPISNGTFLSRSKFKPGLDGSPNTITTRTAVRPSAARPNNRNWMSSINRHPERKSTNAKNTQ
jgi:hypothetical protein